jgi:5'-nucleotidase
MPQATVDVPRTSVATWRRSLIGLAAFSLLLALLPPTAAAADEHTAEIKLFAINDFHGRLLPPSGTDLGGAAYLATHIKQARTEHPDSLFVDAGDLVGATPVLSNSFYDEPTVEVMNAMGLDVQTVGNHEFDRGQDEILRRRDGGCFDGDCSYRDDMPFDGQDFTTLSTNVIIEATGEALTLSNEVRTVAGVDIGFIGVTTANTPNVVSPTGIEGLVFENEAAAINAEVAELEDDVDVIVVLMHEGGRQDVADPDPNGCENFAGAAANIVPQLDDAIEVVVTGHTHRSYVCDLEDGPLVTQAFEYGKRYTEITLEVDTATGEIVSRGAVNHDVTRDVTPDAEIAGIIETYQELIGPIIQEVVGTSEVHIPRTTRVEESLQGNLATDALIDQYETDFAFQNSGGLRADLTVMDDKDGDLFNIRREYVLDVWPFGNIVALAEVDGPTLHEFVQHGIEAVGAGSFLQMAGMRVDYYLDGTNVQRGQDTWPRAVVANVEYWNHPDHADGTPVDLSAGATYTIALNDFMSVGGDGYPNISDEVYSLQDPLEIAVERYLEANSPVSPAIEGRIVEIDPPAQEVTYRTSRFATYNTLTGWQAHVTGDVDGNDRDEVLSYHPRNGSWWMTSYDGTSTRTRLLTSYTTLDGWQAHVTGNVTGNDRDEILSYHPRNGSWWMTSYDGNATTTRRLTTYQTLTGWQSHVTGDVNGNGRDDVLSYHPSNGSWWITSYDGTSTTTRRLTTYNTLTGWQTHVAGDINGNGRDDILSYHPSNGTWWITSWDGSQYRTRLFTTYTTLTGWQSHVTGDITGNGRDDLLSYHPRNGSWWITHWDGSQYRTQRLTTYNTLIGWQAHVTGDVDGNDRDELLSYHPSNGSWWITRQVPAS